MWISDLRDTARDAALDFAWRQWAQLGVSAYASATDRWAIDPEALILFTVEVARRDPRLFDECLDWIAANRRLLSFQRLSNLADRFPVDRALIGAITESATLLRNPARQIKQSIRPVNAEGLQPLFSPDVLAFVGEPDPIFAAHGFARPRVVLSGKSGRPDVKKPTCLAFLLRMLFGPGSRSEAVRLLITYRGGPLDISRVAEETAFARRNVADALLGLADANAVSGKWSGNERIFSADRSQWTSFLGIESATDVPDFVSWVHLLPAVLHLVAWLNENADSRSSDYLLSSSARELSDLLAPDLEAAGISPPPDTAGTAFITPFAAAARRLLEALHPTS